MISLVTSLLLISTASTADAGVKDPLKLKNTKRGLEADNLNPRQWLLIEVGTLRALNKDATAYKLTLDKLHAAQNQHAKDKQEKFDLKMKLHELQLDNYNLRKENLELRDPPWYKSAVFWGTAALVMGLAAGGSLVSVLVIGAT